ncbi:MAG: RNHCP domain-containing protein [Candidatus Gracilibacteria bacterium]|nr:RNHCP domain-containing protein [Candidatus Gracilibacteria bacterium]
MMAKSFQKINEEFVCTVCGHHNPPAPKTCRNHCRKCLHSLHVDISPGDRASGCGGILRPVSVETRSGEMVSIRFHCEKCGHTGKNKIAEDDDRAVLLKLFDTSSGKLQRDQKGLAFSRIFWYNFAMDQTLSASTEHTVHNLLKGQLLLSPQTREKIRTLFQNPAVSDFQKEHLQAQLERILEKQNSILSSALEKNPHFLEDLERAVSQGKLKELLQREESLRQKEKEELAEIESFFNDSKQGNICFTLSRVLGDGLCGSKQRSRRFTMLWRRRRRKILMTPQNWKNVDIREKSKNLSKKMLKRIFPQHCWISCRSRCRMKMGIKNWKGESSRIILKICRWRWISMNPLNKRERGSRKQNGKK